MNFPDRSQVSRRRLAALGVAAVSLSVVVGCQKDEQHPPYLVCDSQCGQLAGISIGVGSSAGSPSTPIGDAGPGTLSGQVLLLNDQTFSRGVLYTAGATVTADGASGSPVSALWDGADDYSLSGVSRAGTNWVSVQPVLKGGDPQLTYQAVDTRDLETVNLSMISGTAFDAALGSVGVFRNDGSAQVVLFFQSKGTHAPLVGLHVTMTNALRTLYRSGSGWLIDDGSAVTDQNGLVVFVDLAPGNSSGLQTVTVSKPASGASPAVTGGSFSVKVVDPAITLATVEVQL